MTATACDTTLRISRPRPRTEQPAAARPVIRPVAAEGADDFGTTVKALAVAVVEVLHGTRSQQTIARWVTPELLEKIRRYAQTRRTLARATPAAAAHSPAAAPRLCYVTERIVEATVILRSAQRSRAVALRLEQHKHRWMVTELVTI